MDPFFNIVITVGDGAVTGGGKIEVDKGMMVRLTVTSDVADEVHIHGYDFFQDLEPGIAGVIEFTADIPGIFEIELENARLDLVELVVGA